MGLADWYNDKPFPVRLCFLLYVGALVFSVVDAFVFPDTVTFLTAFSFGGVGFAIGVGVAYRSHNKEWAKNLDTAEETQVKLQEILSTLIRGSGNVRVIVDPDGKIVDVEALGDEPPPTLQ